MDWKSWVISHIRYAQYRRTLEASGDYWRGFEDAMRLVEQKAQEDLERVSKAVVENENKP